VVNGSASVRVVRCGRGFPGHAIRIVDEHFNDLPERHVGQIIAVRRLIGAWSAS